MKSLGTDKRHGEKTENKGVPVRQVVVFELGDQAFAADVATVREIIHFEGIRPIPHTPASLLGVTTIRGEILPVIDLAVFLKIGSDLPTEEKKLIVVEFVEQNIKAGVAVDNVRRIYNISEDQLDYSLKDIFLGESLTCVIKQEEENILMPDFQKIIEAFKLETLRLNQEAAQEASCE